MKTLVCLALVGLLMAQVGPPAVGPGPPAPQRVALTWIPVSTHEDGTPLVAGDTLTYEVGVSLGAARDLNIDASHRVLTKPVGALTAYDLGPDLASRPPDLDTFTVQVRAVLHGTLYGKWSTSVTVKLPPLVGLGPAVPQGLQVVTS